ncbi:MAG: SGNH/GDSL hydrolase family protein [Deltaproteobacteria bacterium]|nr:MAG: SGNH/GDSL hydrolase family protein [Deltaproteobacteria bacterium]
MAKLVAIGDSLTQGFQSLAIHKTNLSYPAMIAECLGERIPDFRVPNFLGKGGLPLNLEWLSRILEEEYGRDINLFEWAFAMDSIVELIDEVEDYWERGKGVQETKDILYHNLAVWGFEVADAYNIAAKLCSEKLNDTKEDWFQLPSEPRLRTAYRVLNPSRSQERNEDTQIRIAQKIKQQDGEIENLIVWLGANNCLGTVIRLKIKETGDTPPGPNSSFTLWTPSAFRAEYNELADQIESIGAKNVYVATVPHVTIPPVSRGIMKNRGRLPNNRRYYDYYTHFFIKDKSFDPDKDPHLTREDAEKIDGYIDQYNDVIHSHAMDKGWDIVDTCSVLDRLAVRRNHGSPKYRLPDELKDLGVRFFEIDKSGNIANGGLISLDGIHPTTCGYAIVAQEFIDVMRKKNPEIRDIDFAEVRYWDSLVTKPPRTLDDIFGMLKTLEKWFHVSRVLAGKS